MLRVRHSIFDPRALVAVAAREWHLEQPVACTLWRRRLADVFMLRARSRTFVLKVYRTQWRPKREIESELRFARHLFDAGVGVAEPYSGKVIELSAPEGSRYAVLYNHAPGKSLHKLPEPGHARRLGELTAHLHEASADYADARRPTWNADSLLREPVNDLAPFLEPPDLAFLEEAAGTLAERLEGLPAGYCHGDVDPGNVHFDSDGQPVLFDFDFCGIGPRAYDLAMFVYEAHWAGWGPEMAQAFLDGYGAGDPFFIERLAPVRGVWFLGLLARNVDDWGHHELHHHFLDRHLALIRKLMHETAD